MPRLSTELRAQRRQHVLTSAWRCFSRDGFHATSMDDIIAESGISSSAVYRYFRSKDELIEAAADESSSLLRGFFARMLGQDPTPTPAETVTALVEQFVERTSHPDYDLTKIAIYSWAEALRQPDVGAHTRAFYLDIRERLTELALRWQAEGYIARTANPRDMATLLMALLPGLVVTHHLVGSVSAHEIVAGLATLGVSIAAG
jgi:AcrR family transcriptional regulator